MITDASILRTVNSTGLGAPPPPVFSQVFILKVVKVLCFDTLLQVFILKGLTGKHNIRPTSPSWSGGCEVFRFGKRESDVDSQRQGTSFYAAYDNRIGIICQGILNMRLKRGLMA